MSNTFVAIFVNLC